MGIVSMQALSYSGRFSPHIDRIYILNDKHWGGYVPGTKKLADMEHKKSQRPPDGRYIGAVERQWQCRLALGAR